MGRWAGDVFEIYTRLSKQAPVHFTSVIGSTAFHDLERIQSESLDDLADLTEVPLPSVDLDEDDRE